ncbi:GDP-mannose 4,6-dehydratase [Desulfonatronovibrio magnus]|uniref:GDP-mannose 4,6-dehydratase n=1 Tax=Desulfonatronovibrio magnus TaxID=698827 RepID=UPI000AB3D65E
MYLLDTNVVSELRKIRQGKADPGVMRWAEGVVSNDLYLSVITIQELEIGILLAERRDQEKGKTRAMCRVSFETAEYTANADALDTLRILEAIRLLGLTKKARFYQAL